MAYPVLGSPLTALVDAVKPVLDADTTLSGLVTGVYGHVPEAARTAYPYVVLGRRVRDNTGGAMQVAGGRVTLQIDVWDDQKGPARLQSVLSAIARLLERRRNFVVSGYAVMDGSLTCEYEDVFDEPDEDKPGAKVYHGVQRWAVDIHEQ